MQIILREDGEDKPAVIEKREGNLVWVHFGNNKDKRHSYQIEHIRNLFRTYCESKLLKLE